MDVRIVDFPETKVAVLEHRGPPALEYESVRKMIAWRRANHLPPDRHDSYGIHYNDPHTTPADDYHVDLCVSVDQDIPPNPENILNKVIPAGRCALARHIGPRHYIPAAEYLYYTWLPTSGETLRDFPIFFHYVNVGPDIAEHDMITDVYLPLE